MLGLSRLEYHLFSFVLGPSERDLEVPVDACVLCSCCGGGRGAAGCAGNIYPQVCGDISSGTVEYGVKVESFTVAWPSR